MFGLWSVLLTVAVSFAAADIHRLSSDRRIIGGVTTTIEKYPYQVAIEINRQLAGGGAILTEKYVLTAAHVIPPILMGMVTVVAGVTNPRNKERITYKAKTWIPIPGFNIRKLDRDVGIIVVDRPIKFGPRIQPIALANQQERPKPGDMLTLSGWGSISEDDPRSVDVLRAVRIPILSQETCRRATKGAPYTYTNNMMCAAARSETKTAGSGDSGGPAVTDSKKIAGIVSWGKDRDIGDSPIILTDVTSPPVADFIKAVLNGTITENALLEKQRKESE